MLSFGFSVSDFIGLARLTLKLYNDFKEAPGICQAFSKDLLLFHDILTKTARLLNDSDVPYIRPKEIATLKACVQRCKELIYIEIYSTAGIPTEAMTYEDPSLNVSLSFHGSDDDHRLLRGLRKKWGEKKFASKIPQLRQAISVQIQTLTAAQTLVMK